MSSIKIRTKLIDGKIQIRILIDHPMETGRAIDKQTNKPIAAQFIQTLTVRHNDRVIVNTQMGASISRDPYFAFMLKGGKVGDWINVDWLDNLGNKDTENQQVK